MHTVQVGRPEVPLKFPILQIGRGEPYAAAPVDVLAFFPRAQNHPVQPQLFIPEDEGIPPVLRLVAGLRLHQLFAVLLPVDQVVAFGLHQYLRLFALLFVVPVVAGVHGVIAAFRLKNGPGKDKLILRIVPAAGQHGSVVLIMHEIRGDGQRPAEGLAKGTGPAGVTLMKEIEFSVLSKGHAVAKPGVGVLIIELIHPSNLPFQSNPNGSAENDDKSSDRPSPYEAQILCVFSPANPFFVVYYTMLVFPSQALQSGEQGSRCKHTAHLS